MIFIIISFPFALHKPLHNILNVPLVTTIRPLSRSYLGLTYRVPILIEMFWRFSSIFKVNNVLVKIGYLKVFIRDSMHDLL